MDTLTYQDYFQECIFRFVPYHDLILRDAYSQLQEIAKISLLLRVGAFVISRNDVAKLQKYNQLVMRRIEQLEIDVYRKKIKKVFDRYYDTTETLTKFECDYFKKEIEAELLGEAEEWSRRFKRIVEDL